MKTIFSISELEELIRRGIYMKYKLDLFKQLKVSSKIVKEYPWHVATTKLFSYILYISLSPQFIHRLWWPPAMPAFGVRR